MKDTGSSFSMRIAMLINQFSGGKKIVGGLRKEVGRAWRYENRVREAGILGVSGDGGV